MPTTNDLSIERIGPVLYARGGDASEVKLEALIVLPEGETPPELQPGYDEPVDPQALATLFGSTVWRYAFRLPADRPAAYRLGERSFEVQPPVGAASRIAYVSCNGQEDGDMTREIGERDVMWNRLAAEHETGPFSLLLQGGDQLYADDVERCHREVERWSKLPHEERGTVAFTPEMAETVRRFYFDRYRASFARPAMKALVASVPSVMMWDDHDVFDGWGSYPKSFLESPVALGLYRAAREMFLLFQLAASEGNMPETSFDETGATLGQTVRYPGLSVIAPDLRSERRMDKVMGEAGWAGLDAAVAATPSDDRLLLMSSVPALGPRLSWVEALADITPGTQEYEDDLRDQWQSRTHRSEWKRFLTLFAERQERSHGGVTFLSGEIHLATRGELTCRDGSTVHQLVSSGISHPPPVGAYPIVLGLLARVGESPLPKRRSQLHPLPGRRGVYVGERNYLVLERDKAEWTAHWELEEGGPTRSMAI